MVVLRLIIFASLIFLFQAKSEANEVTWLSYDFPPYYILTGDFEGQGRDQMLVEGIHQQLPTLTYKWKNFPTSRVVSEVFNS